MQATVSHNRRSHFAAKRGGQRMPYRAIEASSTQGGQDKTSGPSRKNQGMKRLRQQSVPASSSAQQHNRVTRQKTAPSPTDEHPDRLSHGSQAPARGKPPRKARRSRPASPQPIVESVHSPAVSSPPSPLSASSAPPSPPSSPSSSTNLSSIAASSTSAPSRNELLTGFFYNSSEAGYTYTLSLVPDGDDPTGGEWELYEDFDAAAAAKRLGKQPAAPNAGRRRTTWSGRWSLKSGEQQQQQQQNDSRFGWVELIKTAETVQENGRLPERRPCLLAQCCPFGLTFDQPSSPALKVGIMLNAFGRTNGLFLTRTL